MRKLDKLNAPLLVKITKAAKPGRHSDGSGLYLTISRWGTPSWCFRYLARGSSSVRDMGLGAYPAITLKQARQLAGEARMALQRGIDPIDQRKAVQQAAKTERAKELSFKEAAERYIESHKAGWRNEKHASQWQATLTTYAYPVIAKLGVARICTHHITEILEPIWATKPETASRVRGRIESILDWAKARHYRDGDNPARWKGHLDHLLPSKSKVRQVRHQPAMPFTDLPAFVAQLKVRHDISAKALEFTILTAARTSEAVNATWDEFDLKAGVWTVPGDRMKAGREHRVPLSERLMVLLSELPREKGSQFVFPGDKAKRPLSNMAMLLLLKGLNRDRLTVHGFRSTFRDWVGECTLFPRELAEAALGHVIGDKVEAAYRRGDSLEKRRGMMEAWATYCSSPPFEINVIAIRKSA